MMKQTKRTRKYARIGFVLVNCIICAGVCYFCCGRTTSRDIHPATDILKGGNIFTEVCPDYFQDLVKKYDGKHTFGSLSLGIKSMDDYGPRETMRPQEMTPNRCFTFNDHIGNEYIMAKNRQYEVENGNQFILYRRLWRNFLHKNFLVVDELKYERYIPFFREEFSTRLVAHGGAISVRAVQENNSFTGEELFHPEILSIEVTEFSQKDRNKWDKLTTYFS